MNAKVTNHYCSVSLQDFDYFFLRPELLLAPMHRLYFTNNFEAAMLDKLNARPVQVPRRRDNGIGIDLSFQDVAYPLLPSNT